MRPPGASKPSSTEGDSLSVPAMAAAPYLSLAAILRMSTKPCWGRLRARVLFVLEDLERWHRTTFSDYLSKSAARHSRFPRPLPVTALAERCGPRQLF